MAKKKVEVDESEGLIAKLLSLAPKGEEAGQWEISRTTELVLSQIKYVLTTGIPSFDDIVGGLPIGRMVELYGLESCGKTAMAIRCAARGMKGHISEVIRDKDDEKPVAYREFTKDEIKVLVVYIDNEQSLDEDSKLVVDGEKLDVIGARMDTTDEVFKAIDGAITYQEDRMEMTEKDGILRFMLIVVDTIASTTTKQELSKKWGDVDFPRQPQQMSIALRQLTRRVNRNNVCILFTNQVRVKFQEGAPKKGGQTFQIRASDYSSPGGYALRFYASHRVFMYAYNQKYRLLPDAQFSAGLLIGFHTVKNRLKKPLRDGRMVLLFDEKQGGFRSEFSMLESLELYGFVEVEAESRHTGYTLKFHKNGITPTTFADGKLQTTLAEDEDLPAPRRGRIKDPGFKYRSEWPEFYREHKADVDKLWAAAVAYAMATEGLDGGVSIEEETDGRPEVD